MADDNQTAPEAAPQGGDAALPVLNIVGQYTKDLSFENPNGIKGLTPGDTPPSFPVNINVNVKKEGDDLYAVEIALNARGMRGETVLFNAELVYGGVFVVKNIPENQLGAVLMIECPRLLFPFARQILSTVTGTGGFPPLMLEPVDFTALYRQNIARAQAAQAEAAQKPN